MDFALSDDEVALGDSVRSLCAARFSLEAVQETARAPGPPSLDPRGWASLADAGVFALQVPEAAGGVGLAMAQSAVVFEELGRALVPGPLVSSHLAARDLAAVLPGTGAGTTVVGAVRRPRMSTPEALPPPLVAHLPALDALVLVGEDQLSVVDPNVLAAVALSRSLDPLTPLWRVESLPEGVPAGDAAAAARWRRDECVLTGALLAGLASGCVEMAVEYAKGREQFGKPIGSFQAVKHLCADMLVRAETARVAVQAAAATADHPEVGDPERAAHGAALLASEAAVANAKACIQVHGGMGFTWEVPAHLYLMRARVLGGTLGPRADLAELVAERY